jgi:GT2 family glycosyltransferase
VAACSGDIVLLLNNDIVPGEGSFEAMVERLRALPREVWAVVPEIHREGFGDEGSMRFVFRHGLAVTRREGAGTLYPSGACTAFRKSAWLELGGLDARYAPIYWEDADIGARAAARGLRIAKAEGARIVHQHAATTGHSLRSRRLRERNRFVFMHIHCASPGLGLQTIAWLPVHLLLAALRGRFEFHLGLADYISLALRHGLEG